MMINRLLKTSTISYHFLILFFFLNAFLSDSAAQSKYDKHLQAGIDALYNFEFDKAIKTFNQLIEDYPENPAGYHYKSIPFLWHYLDSRNETDLDSFLFYSEIVINKAQVLAESDRKNPYYNYLIGTSYSYRALAYARSEDYLTALWASKNFYSSLIKAVESDSLYYDAYLGLGIYNFAASQTAPAWQWALELTGIYGDKNIGFNYLNLSAQKGKWSKTEAQFYLAQLHSEFYLDLTKAETLLQNLNNKYPGNLLFKLSLSDLYIKKVDLKKGEKKIREVMNSPDTLFGQIKSYAKFSLGNVFFFQNNFDSAAYYFNEFLESSTDNHFKGIAAFRLALCLTFNKDFKLAEKYYELSSEGNADLDEDRFAKIKAELYVDTPPDSVELKLIFANNLIRSGNYMIAIENLGEILNDSTTIDVRAAALIYLSEASYFNNKFNESLNYAITAFKIEKTENWIKPFACYFAAKASLKLKNILDANLFIRYANNYSDYLFENKLKNLLYSLSYSINK